ncbi:hypothetical protein GQ53DRAFT_632333 [Thozetella sp. PMI_491]|nr:hypothetical protein GQ53DRAFT_632333 [Thozetella sp. PMI_491]
MRDPEHAQWRGCSLERDLETRLERNTESLKNIVGEICEAMAKLQNAFQCFTPLEEEQEKDGRLRMESLKFAVRKLRKRVKITFEKESFESQIARLEKSNDGLRRLREQVSELQRQPCFAERKTCVSRGQLPAEFGAYSAIRRASKALHEALTTAWSNTQAPQLRHSVRLFLDAKAEKDVQMEVAILCYNEQFLQRSLLQTNLLRLQVHSRTLDSITWSETSLLASSSNTLPDLGNGRRKRQKVRFSDFDGHSIESSEEVPRNGARNTAPDSMSTPTESLSLGGHFCPELSKRSLSPNLTCTAEGLGHLDSCSQEAFRHCFFPCSDGPYCTNLRPGEVVLVDDVLAQPVHRELTIVGQLRLAHSLVSAVLKFNSTPWMNELWSVRDLAFFQQGDDLTKSLQTLHFDVELVHGRPEQAGTLMDVESPVNLTRLREDAQYKYGVRNITLYSLGAALLAIGRWERVDPNDIEGIRRLASQSSYLGRAYQELTQKVLDCDFGYGKDLKTPRLQEAIHETVVLELESMIAKLDLARD